MILMEIYYDHLYPNHEEVKDIIKQNLGITINDHIFNYYFDKIALKYKYYYGNWEEFYYVVFFNFMSEITQLIKNDKKKLKSILKKLIIKKFLRQYILHCQFKPGGTGYLRSKSHFDKLHRNKM